MLRALGKSRAVICRLPLHAARLSAKRQFKNIMPLIPLCGKVCRNKCQRRTPLFDHSQSSRRLERCSPWLTLATCRSTRGGGWLLTDEVEQDADRVDRQQDSKYLKNCQRLAGRGSSGWTVGPRAVTRKLRSRWLCWNSPTKHHQLHRDGWRFWDSWFLSDKAH